jgi:hypothetical protein
MNPGFPDHPTEQGRDTPTLSQRQGQQIEIPSAVELVSQVFLGL